MKRFFKVLMVLFGLALFGGFAAAGAGLYVFWQYGKGLPDYQQLAHYEPPVMTRVHASDGRLLAEYATEKRVFVPIRAIPRRVLHAVLAAEDKHFYSHPGIDPLGLLRAVLTNIKNYGSGRRPVGASTITQQVAKNFLLTNEVSYARKIKEAILAFRIERAFSKDRILELYLNEVFLGNGYGVAAAALNYFNKSLDELSIAETAYLAALLKAPNNYHPVRKKAAAVGRRNWVIGRMTEDGYITPAEARMAKAEDLVVENRDRTDFVTADYFAEEVRRALYDQYGKDGLYTGGLSVHTTLDPRLQEIAERTLRDGLIAYDRRHGWRGPIARIEVASVPLKNLEDLKPPKGLGEWQMAVVIKMDQQQADVFVQGTGNSPAVSGTIPVREMKWARKWIKGEYLGKVVHRPGDVLAVGDVVAVQRTFSYTTGKGKKQQTIEYPQGTYGLRQIPEIQGAIVALDPHTGRVLAMSGGFDYNASEFNRATQAKRQPG
ncbi:MAG: transglycosylase domain-containing protein, partial [Magnetovibrio sp.]|nr:transglycosylase domain-containing protein [Magnetovibrio sp.]